MRKEEARSNEQATPNNGYDSTSSRDLLTVQTAMLRGLFHLPAEKVITITCSLEERDLTPHAWTVLLAVRVAAQRLVKAGSHEEAPNPARVMADLVEAGKYTDAVRHELETATVGAWLPACEIDTIDLARSLKALRARRAVRSWASQLDQAAANGSQSALTHAMSRFREVLGLVARAGLSDDMEGAYAR